MIKRSLLLLLLLPTISMAQVIDARLPITVDADSTDYDGKNSLLLFRGLRVTQGNIGIEADEGQATKLDFEDAIWRFEGNVTIDVDNGHIECDSADLKFDNNTLQLATIQGSPATFELRRLGSDEITYAEAGLLKYDLTTGIVEFSENAVITEGGNQISSSFLVYNIDEQRINAQSSGDGDEKVKITYTPSGEDLPQIDADAGTDNP
ncbi:MAG: LptA/OstA family protein [Woeseiaceae bacterium]